MSADLQVLISIRECSIEGCQFFRAVIKNNTSGTTTAIESSPFNEQTKREMLAATVGRIGFLLMFDNQK